jgi:hypothetical protein
MQHLKKLSILLALVTAVLAANVDVKCPVDDMDSYFTGRTWVVSGRLMYQYRCPQQHEFWVRAN